MLYLMKYSVPESLKNLTFYESTHRYFYDGRELMAVSKVFEKAFITDYRKINWEILEAARITGDYVHEIAKMHFLGTLDHETIDPALAGYYAAIKRYHAEHVKEVLYVEAMVYSLKFGYAGTLDIVYRNHRGRICLDDFKTAETLEPAVELQTAAYQWPFERLYGIKINERAAVQLRRSGSFVSKEDRTIHRDGGNFHAFLHALEVAKWKELKRI